MDNTQSKNYQIKAIKAGVPDISTLQDRSLIEGWYISNKLSVAYSWVFMLALQYNLLLYTNYIDYIDLTVTLCRVDGYEIFPIIENIASTRHH